MPRPTKYTRVISVIERRIRQGDYLLSTIPGERRIAEETGVSHMTARKAVQALLDREVLIRRPNGLLDVHPDYTVAAGSAQLVLLYPASPSAYLTELSRLVSQIADANGLSTRPVQYVHWDDPVVRDAVHNPAGTVLIPGALDLDPHVLETIQQNKVVVLDGDLSDRGVPSIRLFPDAHVNQVFDHLRRLGHERIDCISSHFHTAEIHRRIRLWREYLAKHGLAGELWDDANASLIEPTALACDMTRRRLERGPPGATALVGTTFTAAVGAMRACWESGLAIGRDISIAAVNVEPPAQFMTPAVTGLDTPDLSAVLTQCFDWFAAESAWRGERRLEPRHATFHAGESSGPAPSTAETSVTPAPGRTLPGG